jgi:hypothetical protein
VALHISAMMSSIKKYKLFRCGPRKKCQNDSLSLLSMEFCIKYVYLQKEAEKQALWAPKCMRVNVYCRVRKQRVREKRRGVKCNLIWCVCLINSRLSVLALREPQNTLSHSHT